MPMTRKWRSAWTIPNRCFTFSRPCPRRISASCRFSAFIRDQFPPAWICSTATDTDTAELDGFGLLPGLVPDPLFPATNATVAPWENQSFWVTLTIPADAKPGARDLKVQYSFNNGKQHAELPGRLVIVPLAICPPHDFDVIHWWRGEAI